MSTPSTPSTQWAKSTVSQLKEELTKRGLELTGKKADLVARLEQSDKERQANNEAPKGEEIKKESNEKESPQTEPATSDKKDKVEVKEEQTGAPEVKKPGAAGKKAPGMAVKVEAKEEKKEDKDIDAKKDNEADKKAAAEDEGNTKG